MQRRNSQVYTIGSIFRFSIKHLANGRCACVCVVCVHLNSEYVSVFACMRRNQVHALVHLNIIKNSWLLFVFDVKGHSICNYIGHVDLVCIE